MHTDPHRLSVMRGADMGDRGCACMACMGCMGGMACMACMACMGRMGDRHPHWLVRGASAESMECVAPARAMIP